ncbi:MAG: response regulator [Sandaracinaceae bacterium]|nr:response regulator [Sandaracinaceae bacterium]
MRTRLRVAAVDDDPYWLAVLGRALAREGIHVELIGDSVRAIEQVVQEPPHVVITDYNMPHRSGAELACALRAKLDADCPPLVLVTGDASELGPNEQRLFDAVFEKPVRLDTLLRAVEKLARRRSSGIRLRAQPGPAEDDADVESG